MMHESKLVTQIEQIRIDRNVTQAEAAAAASVTQGHWSRIVGTRNCKASTLERMAAAVGYELTLTEQKR